MKYLILCILLSSCATRTIYGVTCNQPDWAYQLTHELEETVKQYKNICDNDIQVRVIESQIMIRQYNENF